MATRTVSSDRDRKMTILLTPYMSCSAKISIYAFFTAAFFPAHRALVMISLYLLGILIGILAALIMNKTAFRGKPVPFVMELPNYRMPGLKSVALLLWEKAKDFLQRAFTVIFLATIIIWFLQSFDTRLNVVSDSAQSLLALIGKGIAPIFAPLGFADWRCATSLISGFIAKESVVSTLEVLLGGTAIVGGKGTLTGCVLGTLLIVLVENSMILIGVPVVWKDVFVGLLIVIGTAVSAYQATHSGTKRRTRTQAKEAQHNG